MHKGHIEYLNNGKAYKLKAINIIQRKRIGSAKSGYWEVVKRKT